MQTIHTEIKVGFVGNPNCGKTTLFNAVTGARQKTANWPGVTVERIEGHIRYRESDISMIDLPGVYSLDAYTLEERITKAGLQEEALDLIINVVDASLLERSLYLTFQLMELQKPMIVALNMMDITDARGVKIDVSQLSMLLANIPVIPISARKGEGVDLLIQNMISLYRMEHKKIPKENSFRHDTYNEIEAIVAKCQSKDTEFPGRTDQIDAWLTHPIWGIPIFLAIMGGVFLVTFGMGDFLKIYLESGLDWVLSEVERLLRQMSASPWMISLVVSGIISGVGGILTFLPNIIILFTALAILEDSGYMTRAAYVMNEVMGKAGLSGRAFLPMLLGFGCSVPAILATRMLTNDRERKRTIFMIPFMSCSARLPVYVLFAGMFFPKHPAAVAYSLYLVGIAGALLTAQLISKEVDYNAANLLLIELPEYKLPEIHVTVNYVWSKVQDYLLKAGSMIFLASIILWLLLNTSPTGYTNVISESFAARIGQLLVPVLRPAGINSWQLAVALLSGISAKEVVVTSLAILYGVNNINSASGMEQLGRQLAGSGFYGIHAYAFMIFCLLYPPCVAAMAVVRKETGSWRFTIRMVVFQLMLAWLIAVLICQTGLLVSGAIGGR